MSKLLGVFILVGAGMWVVPEPISVAYPDRSGVVSECELAKEWVAANINALPTTPEAFGEHSVAFRRAIYGALDMEARISLWQENLAAVALEATSSEQRLLLDRVSRELEGHLRGTAPRSELYALGEEAIASLGMDLTRRAMTLSALGDSPMPDYMTQDPGDDRPDCTCSTDRPHPWMEQCPQDPWRDPGSIRRCFEGPPDLACEVSYVGCGWFGEEDGTPCNGRCWQKVT